MKHLLTYVCILAFAILETIGAKAQSLSKRHGDQLMEKMAYQEAVEVYEWLAKKNNDSLEVAKQAGYCYWKLRKLPEARSWYEKAYDKARLDTQEIIYYALALRGSGQQEAANTLLSRHKISKGSFDNADYGSVRLMPIEGQKTLETYEVTRLSLSSTQAEFSPLLWENNLYYVGVSNKLSPVKYRNSFNDSPFLDLMVADLDGLGKPKNGSALPGKLNTVFNEGPFCILPDGKTMYYTRNSAPDRKAHKGKNAATHLQIYIAKKSQGEWLPHGSFAYNAANYSVGHPTISSDGQWLVFCSDMPGGFGGIDLYRCPRQEDGSWGEPINLGATVNTYGNEMFPHFWGGHDLFFSSDGHYGFGGLDLLRVRLDDKLRKIEFFPAPINSAFDDFGFTTSADGSYGFFSSNRQQSNDDLYRFDTRVEILEKISKTIPFSTIVRDEENRAPIAGVMVEIKNKLTGEIIVSVSDEAGQIMAELDADGEYEIRMEKDGYLTDAHELELLAFAEGDGPGMESAIGEDFGLDISLEKLAINKVVRIDNIYYNSNQYELNEESKSELKRLVGLMENNPSLVIEIGSHTDAKGNDNYNMDLSVKRAKKVVDYLVNMGINKDRLTSNGFGETMPIQICDDVENCPEAMHAINRRTEFKILFF